MRLVKLTSLLVILLAALANGCVSPSSPPAPAKEKEKVTFAVMDDASRYIALYGIQEGVVKSNSIDVEVSYLPLGVAIEAMAQKKYDATEASPIAIPRAVDQGFQVVILSTGLINNKSGTMLYVLKDSPIKDPVDLKGKTISTASLGATFTNESRFVLQEKYKLNVGFQGGDVKFAEIPFDAQMATLKDKKVDAAILPFGTAGGTWKAGEDPGLRLIVDVTNDYRELTGTPAAMTVFVTYPEVVSRRQAALKELNRMLRESVQYFKANREKVVQGVSTKLGVDPVFLGSWWDRFDNRQGNLTGEDKKAVTATWELARKLGVAPKVPDIDLLAFKE